MIRFAAPRVVVVGPAAVDRGFHLAAAAPVAAAAGAVPGVARAGARPAADSPARARVGLVGARGPVALGGGRHGEARLGEWEALLARSKGPDDRLFYVDYADVPVVRAEGTDDYAESAQATRTQLALRHALSQMAPGRAARILALTDGYSTEPMGDIGERLVRQRVSLDYRLVTPPLATDYGINRPAPARARATG